MSLGTTHPALTSPVALNEGGLRLSQIPTGQVIGASGTIGYTTGVYKLSPAANRTLSTTVPFTAGTTDGDRISIFNDTIYTITIPGGNGSNFRPRGRSNRILGPDQTMDLIWDATRSVWIPIEYGPYLYDVLEANWKSDAAAGAGGVWRFYAEGGNPADGLTSPSGWLASNSTTAPTIFKLTSTGLSISLQPAASGNVILEKTFPVIINVEHWPHLTVDYTADATGSGTGSEVRRTVDFFNNATNYLQAGFVDTGTNSSRLSIPTAGATTIAQDTAAGDWRKSMRIVQRFQPGAAFIYSELTTASILKPDNYNQSSGTTATSAYWAHNLGNSLTVRIVWNCTNNKLIVDAWTAFKIFMFN